MKVTIDDVARRAGVSKATVSAVLNHKTVVRAETRRTVLKAIKDLHYRPRPSARSLKRPPSDRGTIALLIRELDNPFYTTLAQGAMQCAAEKDYLTIILSSEGIHAREEQITHSFSHREIRGAVIAPVLEGTAEIEHLFRLKMINFPFVLLESVKGIQANVVGIDNSRAMHEAMKYLLEGGHSRIVHFAGAKHASHTYERIEGFKLAYMESSFAFRSEMIVQAGAHLEDGHRTCLEYFRHRKPDQYPTAIVCFNDLVALGAMSALKEMNIAVPGTVSVIGNDDIPFARHAPVKLTTIRAPLHEMGKKAAEILIRNIESPAPLPVENVVLDAELIVRESTRPLN
jgi:DNA-binding LacI/PurR family transcriptional regulator